MVVLFLAAGYLLYKLLIEDEWSRREYLLLIIILGVGIVNSEIMIRRKKRGGRKE